jgi:hypothetical protein
MSKKICHATNCRKRLTAGKSKYCSAPCQRKQYMREYRHNKKQDKPINSKYSALTPMKGKYYNEYVDKGLADLVMNGELTATKAAETLGCPIATVSKMNAAYQIDLQNKLDAEGWSVPQEAEQALENFSTFRNKYFATETGEKYETADFHENWINKILKSIEEGGELLVLSPPRHGKTELLIHFAIYQICRNSNTRIMWVGGNEDIAKNAVSAVLDQLESNERLQQDFCEPGKSFKPDNRSGKMWASNQFTVGTRTVPGIKSPTMVAVGKGGKILSRDCDLIIADDIEDHQTTMQPGARENTRQWWTTTLSSRKEEHTAVVVIGSRQHPDDLYHHLLNNEAFESIVETAHDLTCQLPEASDEEHTDCMLWSTKRTHKWLMSRLRAAETTGGKQIFEMVYFNQSYVEGTQIFSPDAIDACKRPELVVGEIPKQLQLVAGLDPSSSGYQAAFLWGIDTFNSELYCIDIDNQKGGGVRAAAQIISDWYHKYDLAHWIVEENGFQTAIRQDENIKEFVLRTGILLQGHLTGKNKHDPLYGVGAMSELFDANKIHLPYGNSESQAKIDSYKRQLVYFDGKPVSSRNKHKTDIVMSSWFPMKVFRRVQKEHLAEVGMEYKPSFTGYNVTDMNDAPWQ